MQAYWEKNEDYFNTTFEAEDILHEIDPSPLYGEKKANYTRFFIGNGKTGLNLFSSVMQLLIHSWKEQPFTKPSWSMNESEKIRRAILPKTVVK